MSYQEEFIQIYKQHIHREGADKLLEYLCSHQSDFFDAPASTKDLLHIPLMSITA